KYTFNFFLAHAEQCAIEINVFFTAQFRMKPRSHSKDTGGFAFNGNFSFIGCSDSAEHLQQCAFARTISTNNSEHFSFVNFERNIVQSPKILTVMLNEFF